MSTTLFLTALVVGAPALKDGPAKTPTIEGEWELTSRTIGGKPDTIAGETSRFVISPGKWAIHNAKGAPNTWEMELDPMARPATITTYKIEGKNQRTVSLIGIYKIEGETLTICYVFKGDRPATFESPAGTDVRLMTLKRIRDK
jgi:uncharacterized protein (TIGR03067 family)